MNFDDAIVYHIGWKLRLRNIIDGVSNEKLQSEMVRKDDHCDLGKWIYDEGTKYASLPQYQDLVEKHAKFHACAGDIVKKMESGDKVDVDSEFCRDFGTASIETVIAITHLRSEVNKDPPS